MNFDLHPEEGDGSGVQPQLELAQLSSPEFLALLGRKDIQLEVREGRLVVNAPTRVLDDALRSELKRRKPELLTLLGAPESVGRSPLVAAQRPERIPMTPSQQGIWLIDHFDPGNVAYNIPAAFLFDFALDMGLLQRSVDLLIARHEILRTSFHEEDGELYQSIASEVSTVVGSTDFTSLAEAEAGREGRVLIREQARQPFDLRRPPLVRFHRLRMTASRDVLLINIHHIVADLQSLYILRNELIACYRAFSEDKAPELPELTLHYADYASWLVGRASGGSIGSQVQYWKQKLAGLPPYLEFPSKRSYPNEREAWGATVTFEVPSAASESLIQIGRECGATPFMSFLALYALLIARFSGQRDFCIGSPLTQRNHPETQRMIGLFMNMIAYRVQLSAEGSFRDLLRQVRRTALEAYEQGDVPFQTLVRELRFNRRSPRTPIFQVNFGFEPSVPSDFEVVQLGTDPGTARYDLSLILVESADGSFLGSLEYRTDVFEEVEVRSLAGQFLNLLGEVTNDPNVVCLPVPPVTLAKDEVPVANSSEDESNAVRGSLFGSLSRMFGQKTRR